MTILNPRNRWAYVHMPKTGGSSVVQAAIDSMWVPMMSSHVPAREMLEGYRLWATLRPPEDWYRSWYAHLARSLYEAPNERAEAALAHFGQGDTGWESVRWGLADNELVSSAPFAGDVLLAPGDPCVVGGLYTRAVMHFLMDGRGRWLVDRIVPTYRLTQQVADFGITNLHHRNAGGQHVPTAAALVHPVDAVLWADALALVEE